MRCNCRATAIDIVEGLKAERRDQRTILFLTHAPPVLRENICPVDDLGKLAVCGAGHIVSGSVQ